MAARRERQPGPLEARLEYAFKRPALLERALTHSSYANQSGEGGEDYETLEFLGDAVLGSVVSAWLFRRFPRATEGELTQMRSALVSRAALARASNRIQLGEHLRLGRGEERGGGRVNPALLADALEAVIAALYLDGGMRAAQRLVETAVIAPEAKQLSPGRTTDAKSRLQEWLQARRLPPAKYEVAHASGPDHAREFTLRLTLEVHGNTLTAEGTAGSKSAAQQLCAQRALAQLGAAAE